MYVVNAVFVVICSFIYTFFVDKIDRTKFVVGTMAFFMVLTVFCKISLMTHDPFQLKIFSVLCYISVQVIWLLSLMQFWTLIADYFDTRQAKRLFPLIGAGGLVGMIVAGLGAKPMVKLAGGTDNLLVIWTVNLALIIVLLVLMKKKYGSKSKPVVAVPQQKAGQLDELKESFRYLSRSKLLKNMVVITLLLWGVFTIVDYEFNKVMREAYPDKDELTSAIGVFRGLAGFVSLLLQFLLTQKIINKLGVARTTMLHPTMLSVTTMLMGLKFNFWTASAAKFGDHVMLYTVQDSSYQMLYNPIPPALRGKARALVEGYIKPAAMCIAGILLVLSAPFLSKAAISLLACGLALLWLLFSFRIKKGYVESLVNNLKSRENKDQSASLKELGFISDSKNLDVLRNVMNGDNPTSIEICLDTIEMFKILPLKSDLLKLLESGDHEIRLKALTTLSSFEMKDLEPLFRRFLNDPDSRIKAAVIKALGKIMDNENGNIAMYYPFLGSEDLEVRSEALIAIINIGGLDGVLIGAEKLKLLLTSDKDVDKMAGCHIIGKIKLKYFIPDLLKLFNDPRESQELKKAVIKTLAKIKDSRAFNKLIELLSDQHYSIIAEKGLQQYGIEYAERFIDALKNHSEVRVRRHLVRILDMNKNIDVYKTLLPFISDPDPIVRSIILNALEKRFREKKMDHSFKEYLLAYIQFEVRQIYQHTYGIYLIKNQSYGDAGKILQISIKEENDYSLKRIFTGLSFLIDKHLVRGIYKQLSSHDAKMQALAYETLENIGIKDVTRLLKPIYDERPLEDKILYFKTGVTLESYLADLLDSPLEWIKAAVLYYLGHHHMGSFLDKIKRFTKSPDNLIAENAVYAFQFYEKREV